MANYLRQVDPGRVAQSTGRPEAISLENTLKRGSMVKGLANYLWGNLNYGAENIPGANVPKYEGDVPKEYYDTPSIYSGNREGPVLGELNPPAFKAEDLMFRSAKKATQWAKKANPNDYQRLNRALDESRMRVKEAKKVGDYDAMAVEQGRSSLLNDARNFYLKENQSAPLAPIGSSDIEAYAKVPRWQALGLDGPKSPRDKLNAFEQLGELKQGKKTPILPSYASGDLQRQRELVDNVFKKNLGPEGRYFMNRIDNNRSNSAIHINSKTGLSMDFSTDCPERMAPCPYCYVEHGRGAFKEFNMHGANKTLVETPYRREILAMPEDVVNLANSQGGLRAHSFGDYRPVQDYNDWQLALQDAEMKGLYIKAITKQPEFIHAFGGHPNLRANISIDALPREMSNAPTLEEAIALKAGRDNIKIRAVALTEAQAWEFAKNPDIDVVTMYHTALGPEKLMQLIKNQSPGLIKKVGEKNLWNEIKTWKNMPRNSKEFKRLEEAFPNKICCQSGKCGQDPTKCGFGINAAGGVIAGVIIPEVLSRKEPDSNSSGGYQADDGGL